MNLDLNFTPYTKVNSERRDNLFKVKCKTIKCLEENIGEYPCYLGWIRVLSHETKA